MKNTILYPFIFFFFIVITSITSCNKEEKYEYGIGSPTITLTSDISTASFGDSLFFTVKLEDSQIALSNLKVQLFYTDDMVSEVVLRTKENGEYKGSLYIPFYKDVPDGIATVRFALQNISQKTISEEHELSLTRPDYPYLELVANDIVYKMEKTAKNEYILTTNLPYSVKGYIRTPVTNQFLNRLTFGWVNNGIDLGSTTEIPFSNATSGVYSISFNTLTYAASPFITAYSINGNVLSRVDDSHYKAELNLQKGDQIQIDGFENLDEWWIDSDYFTKSNNNSITFQALSGKYRVTADLNLKYFVVEPMNGSNLATLNSDGTGAIWIIGEGIGKPGVTQNQVGWNTDKAIALAPIGNKKYQITVIGNQTIKLDNINFKFFHQKNWGGEFSGNDISTNSEIIYVGNGTNGRDSGNLGIITGKQLEKDKTYVITVDVSQGNTKAIMTVEQK